MSQTVARAAALPASAPTRTSTATSIAVLVLAALVAALVALGVEYVLERTGLVSAPQAGAGVVAIVMATYAICGAVIAAIFLPPRR